MLRVRNARPVVLMLLISAVSLFPVSSASASRSATKGIVATGSVTCTHVTGSVSFTPAVRHVGSTSETQMITFHASRCITKNSNVKHVTSGTLVVTVHRPSNSCIGLLTTQLPKGSTGTWKPSTIHSTTALFSGFSFVYSKSGDVGFTVPNTGGTAKVTGSFPGKDHGKRSSATVYTNMTPTQFRDACLSSAGLSRQSITSGTATFS